MRRAVKILAIVSFVSLLVMSISIVALVLQDEPLFSDNLSMSAGDIKRAKQMFASHDPRRLRNKEIKWLVIRETDVTLMANYVLKYYTGFNNSWLRVETEPDKLTLEVVLLLSENPLRRYLNIRVVFTDKGQIPDIESVHVGNLSIPRRLAASLLEYLLDTAQQRNDIQLAVQSIKDISMNRDTLVIKYQWNTRLLEHLRTALVPKKEQQRLIYYHQYLSGYIQQSAKYRRISLTDIILALFDQAHERSSGRDVAAENRAAIIVLAAYVNGVDLKSLVPSLENFKKPPRRRMFLKGRHDLAQHFILSAGISAMGGSTLSNIVGMFKEIEDSQFGSGFNFSDLTADRAGTLFGEMATASHEDALRFQQRLLLLKHEVNLLPQVADLSHGMTGAEFSRRYGSTESPAYKNMIAKIDRRIIGLEIYNAK